MERLNYYQTVLDCMNEQVYVRDLDKNILYINPAAERLTGRTLNEAVGQKCYEIFGDENQGCRHVCPVEKAIAEKRNILHHEGELKTRSGDIRKMRVSISPMEKQGKITGGIVVMQDITDFKELQESYIKAMIKMEKMQKSLQESEFNLSQAQAVAGIGSWHLDIPNDIMSWSEQTYRMFAIDKQTPINVASFMKRVHPDDRLAIESAWNKALQGAPYDIEHRVIVGDETRWIHEKALITFDSDGSPLTAIGTAHDVTERKRAEESAAHFKTVLENSLNEIYIFNAESLLFLEANRGARENSGYSMAELRNLTPVDLKPEFTHASFSELIAPLRTGAMEKIQFNTVHRRKDGSEYPVEIHLQLMTGVPPFFVAIILDTTERIQAEQEKEKLQSQLSHAQKMESVGRLAGGVAHDFNNMLSVIIGYTELAMDETNPDEPLYAPLQEIYNAAKRSADVTRQLLAFARKQTIAPKVLDLNTALKNMLKMLRRLIREDMELAWMPGENLWHIKIDPSQLDQILANLVINARDSISGMGKITIETGAATIDEHYCSGHLESAPGDFVQLTISDNGCGMDRETLNHLFDPFFTTKEVGEGSGMGLATVFGIVKQNSGFINVYSEPDKGTTFKIYLPRYKPSEDQGQEEARTEHSSRGNKTFLLVEDEPSILQMTSQMLERLGYTVLKAVTPKEAIDLAYGHSGPIHLLITDVVMPGMNGRELSDKLLSHYPKLKSLFMSGYTANVIAHHGVLEPGVHFIEKPFSKKELETKIHEVLEDAKETVPA